MKRLKAARFPSNLMRSLELSRSTARSPLLPWPRSRRSHRSMAIGSVPTDHCFGRAEFLARRTDPRARRRAAVHDVEHVFEESALPKPACHVGRVLFLPACYGPHVEVAGGIFSAAGHARRAMPFLFVTLLISSASQKPGAPCMSECSSSPKKSSLDVKRAVVPRTYPRFSGRRRTPSGTYFSYHGVMLV